MENLIVTPLTLPKWTWLFAARRENDFGCSCENESRCSRAPTKMKLAVHEFERPDRGFTYELRKWRSLIAKIGPHMRKNVEKSR
jgi:hypothetical protein